ncbi:MAG TPA: hypothetical protein VF413_12370, partial [Cellulomonas sp.]
MHQTRRIVAGGTVAVLLLGFGTWTLFADPSRTSELGGALVVTNASETDPPPSASPAPTTGPTSPDVVLAESPARQVTRPPAQQVTRPPARQVPRPPVTAAPSGDEVSALATTSAASPSGGDATTTSAPRSNGKTASGSAKAWPGPGRTDGATPPSTTPGTSETSGRAGPSG